MSDIIHLLTDDLANKIAAGEVVVRPAAVVKELLENSVDAGASTIQLIIKDGGKSLIQIVDNGCGMSDADARMSFERHATSKIRSVDDLFSIQTMGFRGEALASISAVAKVELKTKLHKETLGTKITIEGSKLITHEPCQTNAGTSISVKSIFYNVPARRKFLKSDGVETKHILEEFIRISLAHPNIKMILFNNEKETYHLPSQTLHKRIAQIFGKKHEERIVRVEEQTDIVTVEGYIGKPEFAKKTKGEQYFFINNRFIRSPYLNHAVTKAYTDFIDPKEYPLYILKLTIDPTKIDINVHPSKHEVKFEDEQHVYTIVSAAVRHALSKFSLTPTLDFEIDPSFNKHEFFNTAKTDKTIVENKVSKKTSTFLKREPQSQEKQDNSNWKDLYTFTEQENAQIQTVAKQQSIEQKQSFEYQFTQVNLRYILVETEQGFLLIDQRRAHQRIVFESILQSIQKAGFPSQKLLFPETIEISAVEMTTFETYKNTFQQLGFELEQFGKTTIIVHATPADLQMNDLETFIHTLFTEVESPTKQNDYETHELMAKHLAMYGAIRYGQKLSQEEMQSLFKQLMRCSQPNYGIRKDKTLIKYTHDALTKAFTI